MLLACVSWAFAGVAVRSGAHGMGACTRGRTGGGAAQLEASVRVRGLLCGREPGLLQGCRAGCADRRGRAGINVVKEVVEGRADFGVGTSSLVVDRARGLPVVAVATLCNTRRWPCWRPGRRGCRACTIWPGGQCRWTPIPVTRSKPSCWPPVCDRHRSVCGPGRLDADRPGVGEVAAKAVYLSNEPFLIRGANINSCC
jgi:hypothetical protein